MKKGMGLSIQAIVIAAIVLIVLIVIVAFVGTRMGFFNKTINTCVSKGGHCSEASKCGEYELSAMNTECGSEEKNSICCIPLS